MPNSQSWNCAELTTPAKRGMAAAGPAAGQASGQASEGSGWQKYLPLAAKAAKELNVFKAISDAGVRKDILRQGARLLPVLVIGLVGTLVAKRHAAKRAQAAATFHPDDERALFRRWRVDPEGHDELWRDVCGLRSTLSPYGREIMATRFVPRLKWLLRVFDTPEDTRLPKRAMKYAAYRVNKINAAVQDMCEASNMPMVHYHDPPNGIVVPVLVSTHFIARPFCVRVLGAVGRIHRQLVRRVQAEQDELIRQATMRAREGVARARGGTRQSSRRHRRRFPRGMHPDDFEGGASVDESQLDERAVWRIAVRRERAMRYYDRIAEF